MSERVKRTPEQEAFGERILEMVQESLTEKALDALRALESVPRPDRELVTAYLLQTIPPGHVSHELFVKLKEHTVSSNVELVPLRIDSETKQIEVFLTERPEDDDFWPGEWHVPGTAFVPGKNEPDAWGKLFGEELHGIKCTSPVFVTNHTQHVRRGTERAEIYWVEVLREPKEGQFFPIDELPENTIGHHREVIELAADHFLETKWKGND